MFESIETLESDLIRFTAASFVLPLPFRLKSSAVGKALLQLAGGKVPPSLNQFAASDGSARPEMQRSASRVVAEVLLSPVCNYFTTLGVAPEFDAGELRDNFRRLMALVHPDARPVGFPEDAASRVNRAYAVLADATTRETYAALELGTVSTRAPKPMSSPSRTIEVRSRRRSSNATTSRLLGWANLLRARQSLLWFAVLLLAPIAWTMLSLFTQKESQRLVVARPPPSYPLPFNTLATPPAVPDYTVSASPPTERIASPGLAEGKSTPAIRLIDSPTILKIESNQLEASPAVMPPRLAMSSPVSPKSVEISSRPPAIAAPTLPPPQSIAVSGAQSRDATPPEPLVVTRAPDSIAPQLIPPIITSTGAISGPLTTVANNSPRAFSATDMSEAAPRVRSTDAEDVVVRFSNAYELGSIGAFSQLLSAAMPGRRQMLSEYERIFSATRQRTIKFTQLKHSALGERLATSGYAVVTTTDRDNRIMTQRVFLEFEIGRDRGEPRIERLANYVIN